VARLLYSLALYLLTPLLMLWLGWRGLRAPDYRRGWGERFGRVRPPAAAPIWVHAASVGEVQAGLPLIRALRQRYPRRPLLVTTNTPTGAEQVHKALGAAATHTYAPLDLPHVVARFLRRVQPAAAVVLETELWPNLYHALRKRRIPLFLVNARLSPRSSARYRRLRPLISGALGCVDTIAAQSTEDAERFAALGAVPARLVVAGNMKFDLQVPPEAIERGRALRQQLGRRRPVWIAASTREGEDEQVLAAHRRLREQYPQLLLILVPRHPERFERVAELVRAQGLVLARRSAADAVTEATAVYLGDTMGELLSMYAAADVAFVGGSLVPVGGHNLLEPAALGLPVVSGPHVFNAREVAELLVAAGGARLVEHGEGLAAAVATLLRDESRRQRTGERARQVVAANRGALERCLQPIVQRLGE
jgi:3-deoxy-D-manno-octulosonic-acid transferase